MKERESLVSECKELLIRLERWIAIDKFVRHQNGSIEAEYVLREILNLVYGWNLTNANDLFGKDQDSFDLSDETNGIAVQVTVTDGADKIRQTLAKFIGKYDDAFTRLVFAYPIISPSDSRADFSRDLNGFDFDAARDRIGLGTILAHAQSNQLTSLRDLLREELGSLAAPPVEHSPTSVVIANTVIAKQGIHMHVADEAQAGADSPTMILSAYARPLPEDLPDLPRYPSPSWASGSEFTVLPLFYSSRRNGDQISIAPVNPYLTAVQNGGPLHTLSTADPWYDVFHFPTLDVKIVNNTGKTLFFHEAEFRVAASKPDLATLPAVVGPMGSLYMRLSNLGWGELENARLRFALSAIPEEQLDEAPMQLPEHLPHSIELGTFASSKVFTLLPFFQIEGIDTNRLADLLDTRWDSDESTVKFNRELEFCYEATGPDEDDRYVDAKELPRADYEFFLQRAAGRFYKSYPCVAGTLDYDETSADGSLVHRTVSIFAVLDFARYGVGAGAPPSNEYHVKLSVEEEDYVRRLPISHALKAGDVDRFLIQLGAEQSSIHDFAFALRFNNDESVEARVHLELFCHPMGSGFACNREFSQP